MTQTDQRTGEPKRSGGPEWPPRARAGFGARIGRRGAILALGGLGAAGLAAILVGPVGRIVAEPARPFPAWAYTMPRGGEAYAAAFSDLDLMATLPCYCGCMRSAQPHVSLKDCFVQPSGEIDPHAAFCQTCQDEAIDAVAMAGAGVERDEIYRRIVAAYEGNDPGPGGPASDGGHGGGAAAPGSLGCSPPGHEAPAAASCAP